MASKQFKIILAGDAKGATAALKDAQHAGDGLINASGGWGGKWAGVFAGMGQRLAEFGQKFRDADGWKAKLGAVGEGFTGMGSMATAGIAVASTAVLGFASMVATKAQEIGGYLYGLGEQFYAAAGQIRAGTGATGSELGALKDSYYDIYEMSTKGSGEVAAAMTLVEQKLNLTGQPLEDVTLGFLRLSSLTGGDVVSGITSVGRAFGDWGIAAEDYTATQDKLFRAWQESGVPIDQLAGTITQYGASLRGLGFDFDESLAMVTKWNEEGVNTELVMGGLRKAYASFSDEFGPNAQAEFQKFMGQIEAAPTAAEGAKIAMDRLGVRVGADFAAAVGEGRFAYQDFQAAISDGDTMKQAAKDTGTWRSSITLMVHTLEAKLGPAAERVFGVINDVIRNNIMPLFRGLSSAWDEGGFEAVMERLPVTLELVKLKIQEWWNTAVTWVGDHGQEIMDRLGSAIRAGLAAGGELTAALGEMLVALGNWFQDTAWPYVEAHWGEWWKAFTDSFNDGGFMNQMLTKLGEILANISVWFLTDAIPWAFVKGWELLIALTKWLGTDGIPTLIQSIGTLLGAGIEWLETSGVSWVADVGRSLWNGIYTGFIDALNGIIMAWNNFSITIPELSIMGKTVPGTGGTLDTPNIGLFSSPTLANPTAASGVKAFKKAIGMANGAVVTSPTLGLIGENPGTTPEIVTPERLMRQIVREEMARLGSRPVQLVLKDGRVLAEVVTQELRGRELALR